MRDLILGESLDALIDFRGKTPKKLGADFTENGVPVASAILVDNGILDLSSPRFVAHDTYLKWMSTPTRKGDVLLTSEAPLGRVARVPSDAPLVLGQRLFGLRGKEGVLDNGFLYYALLTDSVRADLVGRSTGTTVFGIRQSALRHVRIPAPSFSEQRAIAEVLGALDDKIAANTKLSIEAEELMIQRWRVQVEQIAPVKMRRIGDCGRVVTGKTPSTTEPKNFGEDVPFVTVGDMRAGMYINKTARSLSVAGANTVRQSVLPIGSVLMSCIATIGEVGLITRASVTNQQINALVGGPDLLAAFTYLSFKGLGAELQALGAGGSVYTNVSKSSFAGLEIPVPSLQIQNMVVGGLDQVSRSVREETLTLIALRDALLPQLMSGKLRVRDAETAVEAVV